VHGKVHADASSTSSSKQIEHSSPDFGASLGDSGLRSWKEAGFCGALSTLAMQCCLWLAFQCARWQSLLQNATRPHREHAESLEYPELFSGTKQFAQILQSGAGIPLSFLTFMLGIAAVPTDAMYQRFERERMLKAS